MPEAQIGLLYNIAGVLSQSETNHTKILLKSYYLMRCKTLASAHALPTRHFSPKIRCQKCYIEWDKDTEINVRNISLSKWQRNRKKPKELVNKNEVVQICSLCKNNNVAIAFKPKKQNVKTIVKSVNKKIIITEEMIKDNIQNKPILKSNMKNKKPVEVNVYSNAFDVFSIKNKQNTLANTVKEEPKVIKNNKKRKDKFAGLNQKAVLASAKIKGDKEKQNKLNLFLKPST